MPREGHDFSSTLPNSIIINFNPRAPRGARPKVLTGGGDNNAISIHVPREGHDRHARAAYCRSDISIHVPREGHDSHSAFCAEAGNRFQSTCPARGTTRQWYDFIQTLPISIHVPREGHDANAENGTTEYLHFNPRAPRGARPAPPAANHVDGDISIHVPREGHDVIVFNIQSGSVPISIHVPREGHDA